MGNTILVADDSLTIQRVLRHTLQRAGYAVRIVGDGAAAWAQLTSGETAGSRIDLAILDVLMPEVDGLVLLRRMRGDTRLARLPVIMLSGMDARSQRTEAEALGACAYLEKPVSSGELLTQVQTLLAMEAV